MSEGLEQRLGPKRGSCSYFHPCTKLSAEPNTGEMLWFNFVGDFNINNRN